jgi:hypothetical protein
MASIKRRGGRIRVQLRPEERMVLSGFAREVAELLGGETPSDADPLAAMVGMTAPADCCGCSPTPTTTPAGPRSSAASPTTSCAAARCRR